MFDLSPFEILVVLVFVVVGIPIAVGLAYLAYDMHKNPDKYNDPQ